MPVGRFGFGIGIGGYGDPRIDGGWRPWEIRTLQFLNALRLSLEDRSPESFAKALQAPENAELLATLHGPSCAVLETELAELQAQLHEPGANKPALLKQIKAVLARMNQSGCGA